MSSRFKKQMIFLLFILLTVNLRMLAQREIQNAQNLSQIKEGQAQLADCLACLFTLGPNQITNGNFGSGNTGFTSDLTYVASSHVDGGTYSVRNNSTFASAIPIPNMWTCTDHSSGSNTGFLVVNNKYNSSVQSFWKTNVVVEPNTRYIMCFYVNNIIQPTAIEPNDKHPQIQVKINGQAIGNPVTINVQPDRWMPISRDWISGTNTQALIELQDINSQESFNDFALDDVSFQKCAPKPCDCKNWSNTQLTIKYKGENGQMVNTGFKCTDPSELTIPYVCIDTQINVVYGNYNCTSTGVGCLVKYLCEVRDASNNIFFSTTTMTTQFSFNVPTPTNTGVYTIWITPYCGDKRCDPCKIKINIKKIGNC